MTPELDKQYETLIKARNFHYENLNKWLAFFYVAIGAIFAGFCSLHNSATSNPKLEIVIIVVLYLVCICAYLSCKGYYYWENHWILLLHDFENRHLNNGMQDYRVYAVFANKKKLDQPYNLIGGANVSTTKVSLFLTFTIAIFSGAILAYWITKEIGCLCPECVFYNVLVALIESSVITTIFALIGIATLKSNLEKLADKEIQ